MQRMFVWAPKSSDQGIDALAIKLKTSLSEQNSNEDCENILCDQTVNLSLVILLID